MSIRIVGSNERDLSKFAFAIKQLAEGRSNAVGTVTLRADETTTTVKCLCGQDSVVLLSPLSADAAAAFSTTYVSAVSQGEFTLTHDNSSSTDRTFGFACLG